MIDVLNLIFAFVILNLVELPCSPMYTYIKCAVHAENSKLVVLSANKINIKLIKEFEEKCTIIH